MKLKESLLKTLGSVKMWAGTHKSDIYLTSGIGAIVIGTIAACVGARKTDDILDNHEYEIDLVKQRYDENDIETDKDYRNEYNRRIAGVYGHTILGFAKAFAPGIALEAAGIFLVVKSNSTLKAEKAEAVAALNGLSAFLGEYRGRVREKVGEEEERKLYFGTHEEEREVEVEGKDGKKRKKKETVDVYPQNAGEFARVFDKFNPNYQREEKFGVYAMRANFMWLKGIESDLTRKLQLNHQLLVNDIYQALCMPKSALGATYGFRDVAHGGKSDYISLGIDDRNACIVLSDGLDEGILINFEPDGVIIDDQFDKLTGTEAFKP